MPSGTAIPKAKAKGCEHKYTGSHVVQGKRVYDRDCPEYAQFTVIAYGTSHDYCRLHAQQAATNAAVAGADVTLRTVRPG